MIAGYSKFEFILNKEKINFGCAGRIEVPTNTVKTRPIFSRYQCILKKELKNKNINSIYY